MKKVKITVWVIVLAIIAIVIYQNREFFFAKQSLVFNYLFGTLNTPDFYIILLYIAFFFGGFIFASYFIVLNLVKSKKKINMLQTDINNKLEKISALESEIQSSYKSRTAGYDEKTVVMKTEPKEVKDDRKIK